MEEAQSTAEKHFVLAAIACKHAAQKEGRQVLKNKVGDGVMLTAEEFKSGVEVREGAVRPWNQDGLVNRRAYMDRGACAQFAAIWVRNAKYRATGQRVPDRKQQIDEVSWMCEQKHKGRDVFHEFLQGHGLRVNCGRIIFTRNFNLRSAAFFISAQPAFYIMGGVNGDGHGIAFNTTGVLSLFDPNYGEARFRALNKLCEFLIYYWVKAYPDLNGRGFVERYR